MKLSDEIQIGLRRLFNSRLISEDHFKAIVDSVMSSHILLDQDPEDLNSKFTSKIDITKEVFSSLVTFLTESARNDLDSTALGTFLRTMNFDDGRIEYICTAYAKSKHLFDAKLKSYGHNLLKIKSANWKLLFCVKNNTESELGEQLYNIQLACENDSQKINFVCTLQELEELVTGFKDMSRHAQNFR
uniref:COMM domain-containing protein 3 n=1 Tax=Cacopsylla melanoneura TaxID=428564 RepID=A0A8D8RLG0_9HEMI